MGKLSFALLVCAFACSKKTETAAAGGTAGDKGGSLPLPQIAPPKPRHADTAALWALAPADATGGMVIGDGVIGRGLEAFNALAKDLEGKPWAKRILDEVNEARKQAPFDFVDPKAWPEVGADPSKGTAVFFGATEKAVLLVVLPITNREALRKKVNGTVEKVGDKDFDAMGPTKGRCTEANGRYLCAETAEILVAALQPHDPPLAAAVKALPADARGDIEFYCDVAKMPQAQKGLAASPFSKTATGGGSIRLEPDGLTARFWGKGEYAEVAKQYGSVPPPAELSGLTAGAQTVMRWKFEPSLLTAQMPASVPAGGADMRGDLVEQLTGDVQLVTAGKGLVGGALVAKIKDAARVKKAIGATCVELKQVPMIANAKVDENGCAGDIDLSKQNVDLPVVRVGIAVSGNVVLVTMGSVDAGSLKGSVLNEVVSAEAKEILEGPQTMALWSRSLDVDIAAFPKKLADQVTQNPQASEIVAMLNWFASQVSETALGLSVTPTSAQMVFRIVTYAADPAEARAAYLSGLDKRAAGDSAGYAAALAEIETKYGSSLLARRAKLERGGRVVLGPPTAMVAAGAAFYLFKHAADATGLPMPDLGGSFGDPGPK